MDKTFEELREEMLAEAGSDFKNQIEDHEDDVIIGEVETETPEREVREVQPEEMPQDEFSAFLSGLPQNSDATIIISRKPDYNLKFRVPCVAFGHTTTIYWSGQQPEEIYADVQRNFGGGRYTFQIRTGRSFGKTWEITLNDPAEPSKLELSIKEESKTDEHERNVDVPMFSQPQFQPSPAAPVVDPLDSLLDQLDKVAKLKEALGVEEHTAAQPTSMTAEDQLKLKIFDRLADKPELAEKLTNYAFGIFETKKEKSETWVDLAKEVLKNPTEAKQLLGTVFSAVAPIFSRPSPPATVAASPLKMPIVKNSEQIPSIPLQPPVPAEPAPMSVIEPETPNAALTRPPSVVKKVVW